MMIPRVPKLPLIGSMRKTSRVESSRLKWLSVKLGQVAETAEVDEVEAVVVAEVDLVVVWVVIEVVVAVVVKEIGLVPTLLVATTTLAGVMLVTFAMLLKKDLALQDLVDLQAVQVVSEDEVDPVVVVALAWVTEAVEAAWEVAEVAWVIVAAEVAWVTEV